MQAPHLHPTHPSILPQQQQQQQHFQQQQQQLYPTNFNDVKKFIDDDPKQQLQQLQQQQKLQQQHRVTPATKDEEEDAQISKIPSNHKAHSDDDTDLEDVDGQKVKKNNNKINLINNINNNNINSNTNNITNSITFNESGNRNGEDNFDFRSDEEVDVSSLEEEDQNGGSDSNKQDNNNHSNHNDNGDNLDNNTHNLSNNNNNDDDAHNNINNVGRSHKPNKRKRSSGGQMRVVVEDEVVKEGVEKEEMMTKKMKETAEKEDVSEVGGDDKDDEQIRVQKPLGLLAQHGITPGSKNHLNNPFFHQQQLQLQQQQFQQHMQQQQQQRQQFMMQQQQQQYNAFFNSGNRKHKLFGPEVSNEPFPLLPVKSENIKGQNGAIYPEWTAYDKNNKGNNNNYDNKNNKHENDEKEHENGNDSSEIEDSNGLVDLSRQILLTDQRFMPSPPPHNLPIPSPASPNSKSETSGHHWTFEEQFKQLYEMSLDPKRKEFLDDLFSFMQKRGTPVNRIPIMAKQTLDLYELFRLVISKGGLVEVINKKLWREITKGLNLPSSITSAAFTLRTQYMKYLYPYECEKLKLSSLSELQSAIDGNRREGRRPGFDFPNFPPILPSTPSAPHLANLLGPLPMHHNSTPPSSRPPPLHVSDHERSRMGAPNHPSFLPGHSLQQLQQLHHMGGPFRPFLSEHEARMMHEAAARAMEEMAKRVEESARQQKQHLQQLQQQHAMRQQSTTPEHRRSVLTPQQQGKLYDAEFSSHSIKSNKHNDDNDDRSSNNSNPSRHSHNNDNNNDETTNNNNNSNSNNNNKMSPPLKNAIKQNFSRIKISSKKDDKAEGKENTLSVCMEVDGVVYEGMLFASPSPQ